MLLSHVVNARRLFDDELSKFRSPDMYKLYKYEDEPWNRPGTLCTRDFFNPTLGNQLQ